MPYCLHLKKSHSLEMESESLMQRDPAAGLLVASSWPVAILQKDRLQLLEELQSGQAKSSFCASYSQPQLTHPDRTAAAIS